MGLNTIMDHLDDANSDLCYRSLSNLKEQKVTVYELARECGNRGWHCMKTDDRVYIAKTPDAFIEFASQHEVGSYTILLSSQTKAVPRNEQAKHSPPRLPPEQKPDSKMMQPSSDPSHTEQFETLSQRAREAVTCSHCFVSDRVLDWGHVPRRPDDRPDDVAFAPWIGQRY